MAMGLVMSDPNGWLRCVTFLLSRQQRPKQLYAWAGVHSAMGRVTLSRARSMKIYTAKAFERFSAYVNPR